MEEVKLEATATSTRGDVKAFKNLEDCLVSFFGRLSRRVISPVRC